jgi:adenylosuccinate synthase
MDILKVKDPVFEGAQGLLLDQDNKEFFPHVTRSNTGLKNVRMLCAEACISDITAYYVSRTYLTRHGAGPLLGEDPKMRFQDATNTDHPYQGPLRFAPLDNNAMIRRCIKDAEGVEMKLVYTHLDQLDIWGHADLFSCGPTREDVGQSGRTATIMGSPLGC